MDHPPRTAVHDLGLLLIRLIIGVVFLFHGSQKLFGMFDGPGMEGFIGMLEGMEVPYPEISGWLSACTEFVGGLLVFVGFLTRLAVIPMIFNMAVAIVMVHPDAFSVSEGGMEFALTLAVVLTGLLMTGPGRFSIDGAIWGGQRRVRVEEEREETY